MFRKNKLLYTLALFSALLVPILGTTGDLYASALVPQTPMPGGCIPKFIVPLPVFGPVGVPRVNAADHPKLTVSMNEVDQLVLPPITIDTSTCRDVIPGWPTLPSTITFGPTRVWAYGIQDTDTGDVLAPSNWPGVTIEAKRNIATTVTYRNNLPVFDPSNAFGPPYGQGLVAGLITYDQTIHWADPLMTTMNYGCMNGPPYAPECLQPYVGPIPTVVHLHGGETASYYDGGPEQWFTANGLQGKSFATLFDAGPGKSVYYYDNKQEPGTLWFHDHALGATRLNVFTGLAAFYFIRDPDNEPHNLPSGPYEIELAIQDRQFDINSQLFFPDGSDPNASVTNLNGPPPNPDVHPFWIPEFVGDVAVVNGAPWPYLNVEPRRYLFRLLDGSNARMYHLTFGGAPMWLIGADDNYFDEPIQVDSVLFAPGQRLYVMVDFTNFAGQTLTMTNDAPVPFPKGLSPGDRHMMTSDPGQSGMSEIMQFRVSSSTTSDDHSCNPAPDCNCPTQGYYGECKRPQPITKLTWPETAVASGNHFLTLPNPGVLVDNYRQLVLKEVLGPGGPLMVLVNNTRWNGQLSPSIAAIFPDGISELPRQGSIEEWELINLTEDAHPIHTHLAQFQLLNRETYHPYYPSLFKAMFGAWTDIPLLPGCTAGSVCPGYGPPLPYIGSNFFFNQFPLALQQGQDFEIGGNPMLGDQGYISVLVTGDIQPPVTGLRPPEDTGWRDTVIAHPGKVTRFLIRWQPTSEPVTHYQSLAGTNLYPFDPTAGPGYVWHCHIIDHEDNEMMRPYKVVQ